MNLNYASINLELKLLDEKLLARIHELANIILNANENVIDFCMAMGSATFELHYEEDYDGEFLSMVEDLEPDELLKFEGLNNMDAIKEMVYIFDEYNHMFKFTGNSIRITKVDGEVFTVYHW